MHDEKRDLLRRLSIHQIRELAKEKHLLSEKSHTLLVLTGERDATSERTYLSRTLSESKKVKISDITKYINGKKKSEKEVKIEKKDYPRLSIGKKRELERKTGFKCEICGRRNEDITPDIHHIKSREDGGSNRESNLIVLCPNCHKRAHAGAITHSELKQAVTKRKQKQKEAKDREAEAIARTYRNG